MKSKNDLGGKGYQLERLPKICEVPPFFVVLNTDDEKYILDTFDKHGFDRVAVRSSATVEDGEKASFAGVFESILNIDKNNLISAIKQVLLSAKAERVKQYCKMKGIDFGKIEMRVIIQQMVDADISGVCFFDNGKVMIEAVEGLGDKLVSGIVSPDKVLSSSQTKEIENVAGIIQKELGFENGADIEFAYKNDRLYILQARAITSVIAGAIPKLDDYELTFEVAGLGFLFADMLTDSFAYMYPLFTICDGEFKQYFLNSKMREIEDKGAEWYNSVDGFSKYEKGYKGFYEQNFRTLENIVRSDLSRERVEEFMEVSNEFHYHYSCMNTHYTNKLTDEVIIKRLSKFKDIARGWINKILVYDDCFLNILTEKLSKQFNVPVSDLNDYKQRELSELFDGQIVGKDELEMRKCCVVRYNPNHVDTFYGETAKAIIKSETIVSSDLNGQVANTAGLQEVGGKVRRINVDYANLDAMNNEIEKMQNGEILVAKFTAPELIGACAKAKAIITDLGGILSHAAIVARELSLPCIVGTKHATNLLNTGDHITVDLLTGKIAKA